MRIIIRQLIDRLLIRKIRSQKRLLPYQQFNYTKKYGNVSKSIRKKYTFLIQLEHT